ncbi:hypothetical protein MNAN1_001915 [Malassezia nana]|uniref:AD domain-containing protein n=1 Tax=Malassezia nana TaxID=180528 RepID=A0AAF0EQG9_9BASI|nr:hypothetical protein MNAN1_001915 [Malassezia nana]
MARGATFPSGPHPVRDVLQSSRSKIVRLDVSYPSFQAPQYAERVQSITGRLWLYDAAREMVVLETGAQAPLPAELKNTAASSAYEGGAQTRAGAGTVSGFKFVRVPTIVLAEVVPDDAASTHGVPAQLTHVPQVPSDAMEAREAVTARKCRERAAQLGPPEAGELGQSVFDSLSKTLPCRWHESHIIVLDDVVISGPNYDVASTYVPNVSHEQLERLLTDSSDETIAPGVERAGAKALTWQRVTKVLEGTGAAAPVVADLGSHAMASVFSKAFPAAVKEIRVHFSPQGAQSAGARQFILSNFKTIKSSNPQLPFLVREAQGTPARMFVRLGTYTIFFVDANSVRRMDAVALERGMEKKAEIDGLEASAIEKKLMELLSN